jgi:redox-sensitive bicupin YhaK (pirin superfamily)
MITVRKAGERGHASFDWLDTWYTFSFADYHDAQHMGFRALRVINDDTIAGGGGFGTHSHRDMEIITYVLSGALEHKDSMGNGRIIRPGEVQYMAAGTGVAHSEFNPSPTEPVHLLQIWILPGHKGAKPVYAERTFAKAAPGQIYLAASKSGRDGSIPINQDADVFIGKLGVGDRISHILKPGRHGWLQITEGEVELNGLPLKAGDGAAVSKETSVHLTGKSSAQVLFFDLN